MTAEQREFLMGLPDATEISFSVVFDPAREFIPVGKRAVVLIGWTVYTATLRAIDARTDFATVDMGIQNRWPYWKSIPFAAWHRLRSFTRRAAGSVLI